MKKYDILLFDNDETLMDFAHDQEEAFIKAYNKYPFETPYCPSFLQSYRKHNALWWKKFDSGNCTKLELQIGRFRDFIRETGLHGDAKELNDLFMEVLSDENQLLEGALDVVKALASAYKIYIITNGVASSQHRRLGACPLFPYLDGIFTSEEAGFAKPAREYFDFVLERAKITDRSRCLVIGDSLSSDILGANNAGIDCIWYNPERTKNPGLKINGEIRTLKELLAILL